MDPEHVSTFHRGLKANKWKQVSIEEGLMCLNQHFNPINNEEANQLFAQLTTLYKMGIGTEVGRFFLWTDTSDEMNTTMNLSFVK